MGNACWAWPPVRQLSFSRDDSQRFNQLSSVGHLLDYPAAEASPTSIQRGGYPKASPVDGTSTVWNSSPWSYLSCSLSSQFRQRQGLVHSWSCQMQLWLWVPWSKAKQLCTWPAQGYGQSQMEALQNPEHPGFFTIASHGASSLSV